MSNRMLGGLLGIGLAMLAGTAVAAPVTYDFSYTQGPTTYNFGTMTVSVNSATSLAVRFDAGNPSGASGFQVTGFGFDFNPENAALTISNPTNAAFAFDMNSLSWKVLTNLNAIPNPANSNTVTKNAFEFGVTEGNANNINPPGITAGMTDIFYINGFTGLNAATNVSGMIDHVGIRIQSLPNGINGGSLFLIESPPPTTIPEPATLALFGLGLLGLGIAARRRRAVA